MKHTSQRIKRSKEVRAVLVVTTEQRGWGEVRGLYGAKSLACAVPEPISKAEMERAEGLKTVRRADAIGTCTQRL